MLTQLVRINPYTSTQVLPIAAIAENLASRQGPIDVFCWFEGPKGLHKEGADWMKTRIFEPIFREKGDANFKLYSLGAWNSNKNFTLAALPRTTPLCESIKEINTVALESLYSTAFFRFCMKARGNEDLYAYISNVVLTKQWLKQVSANWPDADKSVFAHIDNQPSLLDSIKNMDFNKAYALMQYLEGYYLIRRAVKKALDSGENAIEIDFVLPRGEEVYYTYGENNFEDFRTDIDEMLRLDLREDLGDIQITFSFQFFRYFKNIKFKPYLNPDGPKIENIGSYFSFMQGGN